jgi:hypothetical protein
MKDTIPREVQVCSRKFVGSLDIPSILNRELIGPIGYPNNELNRIAIVAAVMIFGI